VRRISANPYPGGPVAPTGAVQVAGRHGSPVRAVAREASRQVNARLVGTQSPLAPPPGAAVVNVVGQDRRCQTPLRQPALGAPRPQQQGGNGTVAAAASSSTLCRSVSTLHPQDRRDDRPLGASASQAAFVPGATAHRVPGPAPITRLGAPQQGAQAHGSLQYGAQPAQLRTVGTTRAAPLPPPTPTQHSRQVARMPVGMPQIR